MGGGSSSNNHAGGVSAKQVGEIVSAASIAASHCDSRSIIAASGILPALAHLIESTGTVHAPPPVPSLKGGGKKNQNRHRQGRPSSSAAVVLHALTPFHAEFLQIALLAGQYRYASSFLARHSLPSRTTLQFPHLRLDASSYLRAHYYAGLVRVGCEEWDTALDSFHLCLTVPCSTVPSAVCVAARKKSLLVRCLLLEGEELDGNAGRPSSSSGGANAD